MQNNKYKEKYDYEGELITFSKKRKNKSKKSNKENKMKEEINSYVTTSDRLNIKNDKTKDEDLNSVRKNLPQNIVTVPKFDLILRKILKKLKM